MAAFPVDPIYSKILLSATELGCLDEVSRTILKIHCTIANSFSNLQALSIVALLSTDGIFKCPVSKRAEALTAKQKFISEQGDHITMLNVFKGFCTANLKKV